MSLNQQKNVICLGNRKRSAMNRRTLTRQLRNAIKRESLDVYYQPQVDLRTGVCSHLEALVRWTDPTLGYIPPSVFIPMAEQNGLMHDITRFVIQKVITDVSHWKKSNVPIKSVGINVSALDLSSSRNVERLLGWLTSGMVTPEFIVIELTETAMVQNKEPALRHLKKLNELGFKIALDDFGTGYSSLAYLLEFPIDMIKVERSFLSSIAHCFKSQAILRSLFALAKVLNLDIVAEGVENPAQVHLLKKWGASLVQGFYFSKPLPKTSVVHYLEHQNTLGCLSYLDDAVCG